jgi:IstB-like ATP binding protein
MLTHPTLDKLQALKLMGMYHALMEQMQMPEITEVPFEERLGLLVDRESTARADRRLKTRLHQAKLRQTACIEDIDYRHPRGLDKSLVLSLATCQWVRDRHNVLITGPTGIGKPQPRNYPCRSQRRTGTDHHCHRSSAPAVWPDPHAGRDDPPCDTRPVWCGVAAAPNRTTGACASHQPRI